ncbi:FAD-dependent oxidoreductase [Pelotomaculum propionicicum]|uniref:FAD-dependent oxidoreductase n=1 Tax=Pelotomaculum propionicicum TaxID=258475 RepID=UPI003B7EC58B
MNSEKVVIIGGVAAGTKAAAKAMRENPDLDIVVLTKDRHVSYAGCGLPYYIGDVIKEEKELLVKRPKDFRADFGIEVITDIEATKIMPGEKTVLAKDLNTGEEKSYVYDKLVLATGASPFIPPVAGTKLGNVITVRTVNEATAVKKLLVERNVEDAVVVGGGMIGLEVAENLSQRGIWTTVVELAPHILPTHDVDIALNVQNYLAEKGVNVITGTAVKSFEDNGHGYVAAVSTDNGFLKADLVVLSVGVRPNVDLARDCGITLGPTGAVAVNDKMETNIDDIYAVGDCAENVNLITGRTVWYPMGSTANKTGRVAGINMAGAAAEDSMKGVLGTSILKLFSLNIAKTGLSERDARSLGYKVETVLVPAPDRAHYYPGSRQIVTKLIVDRDSHRVLGGQIFGEGVVDKPIDILVTAISFGATVDQLAKLDLSYAPPYSTALSTTAVAANVMMNKLAGKFTGVGPLELKEKMEAGAVLVDVTTDKEYMVRNIPGSVNIPLRRLLERSGELDRKKEIILYCKVGLRSYLALLKLKRLGFEKVSILEGGLAAYPFETE